MTTPSHIRRDPSVGNHIEELQSPLVLEGPLQNSIAAYSLDDPSASLTTPQQPVVHRESRMISLGMEGGFVSQDGTIAASTYEGGRLSNEDGILVHELPDGRVLLAVADGMGGHGSGEIASDAALRALRYAVENGFSLAEAAADIPKEIWCAHQSTRKGRNMGAVYVAALYNRETGALESVHQGDAGLLVIAPDGKEFFKTTNHTRGDSLVHAGTPREHIDPQEFKNPWNACSLQQGEIYSRPELVAEKHSMTVPPGSRIILASDGLFNVLPLEEILELNKSSRAESSGAVTQQAIDKVYRISAERDHDRFDNISVITIGPKYERRQ